MPNIIEPPAPGPYREPPPTPKRWTRRDCEFLVDNELLVGRYELIDGEIVSKMGQKPPHAVAIMRLTKWLVNLFGGDFVRIQLPIDVAEQDNEINEPEPDAVALAQPGEAYMAGNPDPVEVLLAIEVADSSLRFDLITKAALYARAAILEFWVLDIVNRRLVVHRQPSGTGYAEILEYAETEQLAPISRPESLVLVSDLLPPRS